jgi:hypothetical protein
MQDMLNMKNVLVESLGLKVNIPMVIEMDNQEAVYSNNWRIGGRTRHIDFQLVFP